MPATTTTDSATTKLEHALNWARRGLAVFPLQEGGKEPLPGSNGHLGATTDPGEIRSLWTDVLTGTALHYNIGATPRDGRTLVVDLDVKDGRDGVAEFLALGGEIGGLVVKTAGGGTHVYFAAEDIRTGAGKLAPGIDTRGADGYVVAPGSVIDGRTYTVVEDTGIRPLPAFVAEKVGTRAERDRARQITTYTAIESDRFANVRRAVRVAKAAEPAVGGVWHEYGFRLGAEMARIGLSGEMAVRVLERHWAPRGAGFKSRDRFVQDVLGGYETAVRDYEHGKHAVPDLRALFQGFPVVLPPPEPAMTHGAGGDPWHATEASGLNGSRLVGLSPSQCANMPIPPYIIKGLLAKGQVGVVAALPASGKSCFIPLLAYRLAQGQTVFARRTKPGRVAYFGLEDERGMAGRIQALQLKYGDAPDFRLFVRARNLLTCPEEREEIKRIIRVGRPDLVIFDTLRAGWAGLAENDADQMGQVVAFARELTTREDGEPGPSVLNVHHTTKAGGQTASGSGVLEADADVTLFLAKDPETNVVTVTMGKNRNGESFGQEMCFGFESVRIGTDQDGDPVTRPVAVEIDPGTVKRTKALAPTQRKALTILEELVAEGGPDVQATPDEMNWAGVAFGGSHSVPRITWQVACEARGLSTASKPADRANVFRKALRDLVGLKLVAQLGEQIFLLKQEA